MSNEPGLNDLFPGSGGGSGHNSDNDAIGKENEERNNNAVAPVAGASGASSAKKRRAREPDGRSPALRRLYAAVQSAIGTFPCLADHDSVAAVLESAPALKALEDDARATEIEKLLRSARAAKDELARDARKTISDVYNKAISENNTDSVGKVLANKTRLQVDEVQVEFLQLRSLHSTPFARFRLPWVKSLMSSNLIGALPSEVSFLQLVKLEFLVSCFLRCADADKAGYLRAWVEVKSDLERLAATGENEDAFTAERIIDLRQQGEQAGRCMQARHVREAVFGTPAPAAGGNSSSGDMEAIMLKLFGGDKDSAQARQLMEEFTERVVRLREQ